MFAFMGLILVTKLGETITSWILSHCLWVYNITDQKMVPCPSRPTWSPACLSGRCLFIGDSVQAFPYTYVSFFNSLCYPPPFLVLIFFLLFVQLPLIIFFLLIFTCCTSILPSQVLPASCTGLPPSWVLLTSRTSHSLECPPASRTSLPTSRVTPICISHKSPNLSSVLHTCILHKSPNFLYFAQVSQPLEFPLASRTSFTLSWVPLPPLYLAQISYPLILYFSLMLLCVISYQCIGHSSYHF